jgi:hypothetical protein
MRGGMRKACVSTYRNINIRPIYHTSNFRKLLYKFIHIACGNFNTNSIHNWTIIYFGFEWLFITSGCFLYFFSYLCSFNFFMNTIWQVNNNLSICS